MGWLLQVLGLPTSTQLSEAIVVNKFFIFSYCRSKSRQYCCGAEINRKSQIAAQGTFGRQVAVDRAGRQACARTVQDGPIPVGVDVKVDVFEYVAECPGPACLLSELALQFVAYLIRRGTDALLLEPGENNQYGVGDLVDFVGDLVESDTQAGIAFQVGIPFRIDDRMALRAIPMFRLDFERRSKGIGDADVVDGHTHPDRGKRLCRIFQREADHPADIEVLFLTHGHSIEWFLRTFFKGRSLLLPRLAAVRVICPK